MSLYLVKTECLGIDGWVKEKQVDVIVALTEGLVNGKNRRFVAPQKGRRLMTLRQISSRVQIPGLLVRG